MLGTKKLIIPLGVVLILSLALNVVLITTKPLSANQKTEQMMDLNAIGALQSIHAMQEELSAAKARDWKLPTALANASGHARLAAVYAIEANELAALTGQEAEQKRAQSQFAQLWPELNEIATALDQAARQVEQGETANKGSLENIETALREADFPLQIETDEDWEKTGTAVRQFLKTY